MGTSQRISATAADSAAPAQNTSLTTGRPIASAVHTIGLLAFLTAWAYFGREWTDHMRAQATPNHMLLYLPTLAMEWSVFGYIVWGVRKRGISLRELVGPRWSKGKQNLVDLGIAACFELAALAVLGGVAHLLHTESGSKSLMFMMPATALELAVWLMLSLTAGICEETIFRGYFQRQFIGWTGSTVVGIVLSAAIFGAGHIYQGWKQTIVIGVFGAMFGALAVMRRSLKPGMIAHSFQDSAAGVALMLAAKYGVIPK
jgi:membrane protease YdiL (CAAX protease family)